MTNVLVDSSVLISFYDQNDVNHQRAIDDLDRLSGFGNKLWLVEHVLDEVVNILLKKELKPQLKDFLILIETSKLELYLPKTPQQSRQLILKVFHQVVEQKNSKISFTDMYQQVLSESNELPAAQVLSYDHHLQQK